MGKDITRQSVERALEALIDSLSKVIPLGDPEIIEEREQEILKFLDIVKRNRWTLDKKLSRKIKETFAKLKL